MSEDLSIYDCMIAIVGEEIEGEDLYRYREIIKRLEAKLEGAFTCAFPMKIALKNIRFESRKDYQEAIEKGLEYFHGKLNELQEVIYVRVNSSRSEKCCSSVRCPCPPKAY